MWWDGWLWLVGMMAVIVLALVILTNLV